MGRLRSLYAQTDRSGCRWCVRRGEDCDRRGLCRRTQPTDRGAGRFRRPHPDDAKLCHPRAGAWRGRADGDRPRRQSSDESAVVGRPGCADRRWRPVRVVGRSSERRIGHPRSGDGGGRGSSERAVGVPRHGPGPTGSSRGTPSRMIPGLPVATWIGSSSTKRHGGRGAPPTHVRLAFTDRGSSSDRVRARPMPPVGRLRADARRGRRRRQAGRLVRQKKSDARTAWSRWALSTRPRSRWQRCLVAACGAGLRPSRTRAPVDLDQARTRRVG